MDKFRTPCNHSYYDSMQYGIIMSSSRDCSRQSVYNVFAFSSYSVSGENYPLYKRSYAVLALKLLARRSVYSLMGFFAILSCWFPELLRLPIRSHSLYPYLYKHPQRKSYKRCYSVPLAVTN